MSAVRSVSHVLYRVLHDSEESRSVIHGSGTRGETKCFWCWWMPYLSENVVDKVPSRAVSGEEVEDADSSLKGAASWMLCYQCWYCQRGKCKRMKNVEGVTMSYGGGKEKGEGDGGGRVGWLLGRLPRPTRFAAKPVRQRRWP